MSDDFYHRFHANNAQVWKNHPLERSLVESERFREWWDSLQPFEREAVEKNIDQRLEILERWKLTCQDSPSPTPRTQLSAVQLLKISAFGRTNGPGECPVLRGGKSKSPTKP